MNEIEITQNKYINNFLKYQEKEFYKICKILSKKNGYNSLDEMVKDNKKIVVTNTFSEYGLNIEIEIKN